ncbi:hypothetical protein FA95DRAFT_738375 [Auriscalpium vulgare]|uniref:Uncharacterized protein n=1 Tax=Auriscalpium vulgare TaxID=40419 RepID=A0ACB8SBW7_9AGAM|nr:hypothetical protein FA95DRAFT_738375 [Auriscalpium vulgare]
MPTQRASLTPQLGRRELHRGHGVQMGLAGTRSASPGRSLEYRCLGACSRSVSFCALLLRCGELRGRRAACRATAADAQLVGESESLSDSGHLGPEQQFAHTVKLNAVRKTSAQGPVRLTWPWPPSAGTRRAGRHVRPAPTHNICGQGTVPDLPDACSSLSLPIHPSLGAPVREMRCAPAAYISVDVGPVDARPRLDGRLDNRSYMETRAGCSCIVAERLQGLQRILLMHILRMRRIREGFAPADISHFVNILPARPSHECMYVCAGPCTGTSHSEQQTTSPPRLTRPAL